MKKILSIILCLAMMAASFAVTAAPTSAAADPAQSYVRETAPNEDADIRMWFNHANVKVHQEDTSSTGRDTYSVYMAKNEYQGAQVTLYSPSVTKTNISANISAFEAMDGSGATMSADVYYEFYIKCENLDTTDIYGVADPSKSFIRNGMIPDAMAKVSDINQQKAPGKFTLTAGLTQTLYIKIKSELDTPPGWYSARFNVTDTDGNIIKTATVYAYVWNFEIPVTSHLQTGVCLGYSQYSADNLYKNAYDYLLDNRLCAFEVPGGLTSSNEYLADPRVTAIAVQNKTYRCQLTWKEIQAIYEDLSTREDWEQIKDKFYFYVVDEPRSQQVHDVTQSQYFYDMHPPIDEMFQMHARVERGWPGAVCLTTIDDNQPYPPGYDKALAWDGTKYLIEDDGVGRFSSVMDTTQGMMNEGSVDIWCMKTQAFTPHSVLDSVNYRGLYRVYKVMYIDGQCSGFDYGNLAALYFNWDSIYGPFSERFAAYQAERAAAGDAKKLWMYMCGKGPDYTYCNHLIENTGLQTNLLFWQTMQNGATGYLYYAANFWTSSSDTCGADGSSVNYDGSTVSGVWNVNRWKPTGVYDPTTYPFGDPISQGTYGYGNGVLLYGKDVKVALRIKNTTEPLGTVRVEQIRDGIEDYEMLYQYREAYGETAMQNMIKKVSNNVVDYLSMPSFDTSSYGDATPEDIFASVRIELGNAVESSKTTEHVHVWNDGEITVQPTYRTEGEIVYTCTVCGETRTETLPVLESVVGDVNLDGKINLNDLADIKKLLAGAESAALFSEKYSDINGDGRLNLDDLKDIKILLA